ncbi:E3 ubiquitin-protein ligase TRIM39-like [Pecten maximus]|uniref:E3 ubiquitin-protein ligase TRIM39-like n=1 Tax=Pecten maximus TaxID=6579 RepID=UPI001458E663|nr:E3 ubiquitin-protein ligase TRIM39-like [Pecten maximus]XP_033747585.1 E3 ubiquitin-protein ligase TRIM39-like [Pecten maximus]
MSSRKKKDYTKLLSITECGICSLELSDPRRIECGHIFCLHCLRKHVDSMTSCPTCKRRMQPKSGNVENYPVAMEIVHLLQSLQKVASYSDIVDEDETTEDVDKEEDQYEDVDADQDKGMPPPPRTIESNEVCDIHRENLKFVCETCDDELICAKCIMHSTHKKLEISQHTKHLEQLLDQQKHNLLKRQKDDKAEEEKLQDMIEKQFEQKEAIKDEIEEIAEEMFTEIHRKKEEMLQPIEVKADEYVKQLTERQEHIKDRLSEFNHVSNRIGKLSNDGTTDFCRKAKRLVKQADIALRVENKPLPQYQTIDFTRNKTAIDDLSKLQLGDVKIREVLIDLAETYDASDFSGFQEPSSEDSRSFKPPPPPVRPKPKKQEYLNVNREESVGPYRNLSNPSYPHTSPPIPPRSEIPDQIPLQLVKKRPFITT